MSTTHSWRREASGGERELSGPDGFRGVEGLIPPPPKAEGVPGKEGSLGLKGFNSPLRVDLTVTEGVLSGKVPGLHAHRKIII